MKLRHVWLRAWNAQWRADLRVVTALFVAMVGIQVGSSGRAIAQDSAPVFTADENKQPTASPTDESAQTAVPTPTTSASPSAESPAAIPVEPVPVSESPINAPSLAVQEIVVTANRREQSIQDVVGSIQALGGEDLDKRGVNGLDDYIKEVPGVGFQKTGNGGVRIGMRGISNVNAGNHSAYSGVSTVGLYLNDVPMSGSGQLPDLNLYDLNRVEALKGPQGTLYGEGAMGGAIKMILNAPSFDSYETKADLLVSHTAHGGWNKSVKAAWGGPVWTDKVALRLVGTLRETSGYIDDLFRNEPDANSSRGWSLRGLAAFNFSDATSGELLILNDHFNLARFSNVNPDLTPDKENQKLALLNDQEEETFSKSNFRLFGFTLKHDFGPLELTSVSSYLRNPTEQVFAFPLLQTTLRGGSVDLILANQGLPVTGLTIASQEAVTNEPWHFLVDQTGFTQELRMVSTGDERFDWIGGIFYRNRSSPYESTGYAYDQAVISDPTGGALSLAEPFNFTDGRAYTRDGDENFEQYAVYGEGAFEIFPSLELTAGLRYFTEKITFYELFTTYNVLAAVFIGAGEGNEIETNTSARFSGFLPKVSLAWKISDEHMIYGLASRGFRSGLVNNQFAFEVGKPIVNPDYLWNYEVGTKTSWFDSALTFNASAFLLDWTDFQSRKSGQIMVGNVPQASIYVDNAGDAEVYGAEMALSWLPFEQLTLNTGLSYLHGELTRVEGGADAAVGSKLPSQPQWSPTAGIAYQMKLFGGIRGVIDVAYQFIDEQTTILQGSIEKDGLPIRSHQNVRAGIQFDSEAWGLTLFGDNLLNERPELGRTFYGSRRWTTVGQPLTMGVQIRTRF